MYTLYVNGKLVGSGQQWREPDLYTVKFPATPRVVIAIVASQGPVGYDIGLIAAGKLWDSDKPDPIVVDFGTDAQWVTLDGDSTLAARATFVDPSFVDASWKNSHVVAAYTDSKSPWSVKEVKEAVVGKAVGKRIMGMVKIPDAPEAALAEIWKL
ncbi:hypothetical protein CVT24_013331 [Panaeolus cyanescens]|uniref:Uncharacterized protein n=1 Tax=Panaeolus cyanescens TaxID=181874 RepID=A0A409X253_9AGAR|nr:hypothetical protein CVT24_013331 [Panaeolus cyanescens]